ncbi:FAD-dependent oxidoreductase [Nocardia callitridis]|uniref:FAD-dependent oxidoreductase n=1 Tax=Nocardia callitridis TaxID=648753 RepID=A0ABP9KJY0_9NOCA
MTPPRSGARTEVLIVGGGITGLSTALFLARAGIRTTLVERHPATALQPQARAFNPRTMEIYRALGLEQAIRDRTSILADFPEMIGAETLAGAERFRVDILSQVRPPASLSPTDWTMIDQDELERVVCAEAEKFGADIRFATELVAFDNSTDGVVARLRDVGGGGSSDGGAGAGEGRDRGENGSGEFSIHADYLVAADGNRAGIRTRLGVEAQGPGELLHAAAFVFDADLTGALRERRFLLGYLDQPITGTALVPGREFGRWSLGIPFGEESGTSLDDFTEQRCVELTRRAIGDPTLEVRLVPLMRGSDQKVAGTRIGAWVADRYRDERVFFVGDAAHVFPPTGSFGANTGIADAHNLAWKLAAVLKGQAGEALLNTYEPERRPVALVTLDQAMQRLHGRHHAAGDTEATIDDLTMILGYRYRSTAVIGEHDDTGEHGNTTKLGELNATSQLNDTDKLGNTGEHSDTGAPDNHTEPRDHADPVEDPRHPSGRPGSRAPHLWLRRGGAELSTTELSTTDLFDGAFVLLVGPDGTQWAAAAETSATASGIELHVHRIGADYDDVEHRFLCAYGLADTGAALVRPDGFLAWRAPIAPPEPDNALLTALATVLARDDLR